MDNRNTDAAIESSDDLSALAWVHDELRRSLDAAHKALRRFVKESEAMAGSDTDAVDPSVLRTARQQIHQGVGALELVGLPAAATMLRACEAAVQRFVLKPHKLTSSVVDDLERASFALLDYLSRILAGKTVSPLSLFPQFRAVQEAAGVDRVHPADLWAVDWRWHELPDAGAPVAPRQTDPGTRQALEQQMLAMMRGNATVAAARMSDLFAGLGNGATAARTATLWRMAAAVFEAQSQGLLQGDVFSKRVAARLLSQLRIIERGDIDVSERLAQDLLFFCSQATAPLARERAPRLASVREAYHLDSHVATDYTTSPLGKFDPAWIAQARKRVGAAKESWSGVAGGEMHRMNGLSEQFALVGDSLRRLFPGGDSLAGELQQAVHIAQQGGTAPAAPLAMEVATSLLYVEASLEDAEFDNPEQSARVRRLADRIADVRRGATPAPLEGWMEDLYRRVSDRQTMGSVVQELRSSLSEVEKLIDQFFRKPADRSVLIPVPGLLASMRGVLSVLGMDQASTALLRMRDEVDGLSTTPIDGADAARNPAFQRLAGNLGALGFLIDMLSVQPAMAKSLFAFDPVEGTLSPVMGRSAQLDGRAAPALETPPQVEPRLLEQVQMLAFTSVSDNVPLEQVTLDLSRLSEEAGLADQPGLKATMRQAQASLEQLEEGKDDAGILTIREQISEALVDFVHTASDPVGLTPELVIEPAPAPAPASQAEDLAEDDEMREIFLEEAREVLENANAAVAALAEQPDDLEQLTTLRRAYHTLKGSSRMVGLKAFGDAAWVCEQLYNTRLADQQPADEPLLQVTGWSLEYLGAWVAAIEARRDDGHQPSVVEAAVAALDAAPVVTPPVSEPAVARLAEPEVSELSLPLLDELPLVDELPSVFAGLEGLGLPPDLPTAADLDLSPPKVAAAPAPEPEISFDLDLSQFEQPNAPPAEPATRIEPRLAEIDLLNLDFGSVQPEPATLIQPRVVEPATLIEPRVAEPATMIQPRSVEPVDELASEPITELITQIEPRVEEPLTLILDSQPEAVTATPWRDEAPTEIEVRAEAVSETLAAPAEEAVAAADADDVDAYAEEDQVKVVGPLRISIPLFNIFLTEADELSRRLTTEVAEWAMELHRPVGETAIAQAHSLAGSSATVGFAQLSQLARALEHALSRSHTIGRGTPDEGDLFVAVAEEVRRLLHQFAAGFLKSPPQELLDRLHEHELTSARRLEAATAAAELNEGTTGPGALLPTAMLIDEDEMVRVSELDMPTEAELDAPVIDDTIIDVPVEPEAPVSLLADLGQPAVAEDAAEPVIETVAEPVLETQTAAADLSGADLDVDTELSPFARSAPAALTEAADIAIEHVDLPFDDLPGAPLIEPLSEPVTASATAPLPLSDAQLSGFALPDTQFDALGQAELKPFVPFTAEALRAAPVRRDEAAIEGDDEIDAVDAVDAELFPIFEEEADELLPALNSHLRSWAEQPGEPAHAAACMRTLHTLKGGARLAGAMRLGEMAHRLESRIELLLAHPQTDSVGIEALHGLTDALSHTFDALRAHDQQAYDDAVASADDALHRDSLAVATRPAALTSLPPAPAAEPPPESAPAAEQPVARAARPVPRALPAASESARNLPEVDWTRFANSGPTTRRRSERVNNANAAVRVRAPLLDRMVNQAGEVSITRSRIESEVSQIKGSLGDLTDNLERLRQQLRDIELQAETQMSSRLEAAKAASQTFDPLEFDRFTRFQELTRMMAESVNDVATVQRTLQRTLEVTEDELVAQARLTRDLQDDLLRTRMVEFESMSDRLYRVVRQAAKETGKHVRLDILGGSIEVDRGVLDRMIGAFEHLLRNSVTHGVESPEARAKASKDATGNIVVALTQEGNEVGVEFRDDGAGLNLARIREKALAQGLLDAHAQPTDADLANFIFTPGFSTADTVTELAGRGVGMDVVRSEVNAMGGRIETSTAAGQGTSFKLVLPLTTAVTQVVMVRIDNATVAIPSTLIEIVRRATVDEVKASYQHGAFAVGERSVPFFWLGSLLHLSPRSSEVPARTRQVLIIRSAQQRIALHVDEVLGNQEVVVKNLGPQLSRMPGLAGLTLLASGAVALIYNPVALATLYGSEARAATVAALSAEIAAASGQQQPAQPVMRAAVVAPLAPLVLVVDDSLTVRRVTQRLLTREGYRVTLAKDGLDALERLAEEKPEIVLSDIEMPRMDGFDLVRNIRNDPRLRDLPVIMITSRIAQKHRDYAAELGVDHYLGKPYSEEDLLVLIGRYTASHAMPA